MTILVGFPLSHEGNLLEFLTLLSDLHSSSYHHYLTQAEFDERYGGAPGPYQLAVQYFGSFGVANLTTSADHLVITFRASSSQVESLFHIRIDSFSLGRQTYFAPVGPVQLPAPLAGAISSVEGLSSYASYLFHPLGGHSNPIFRTPPASNHPPPSRAQGFLEPATVNGVQLEFAPDFQVSYDELSLFAEAGFPTSAVIATILVGGCSGSYDSTGACPSGEIIAPWNPNDIYSYYNETLPSGEPHAAAYGVNLFGAVAPGTSAQYDQSGAVGENTLDLEMAGSTAPGASLYNVYGPDFSNPAYLDGAFSYILNPTNTPALSHVSVISNSWGGQDTNDSVWYGDLQEAQARGISVLASSGDGGDNPASSKWGGSVASFPASMSYDSFGMTAVGGTTVALDPNSASSDFLHLVDQAAWYITAADTADGGPAGTEGGLSLIFPEPSWQKSTSANAVIQAAATQAGIAPGRGIPDLGVIANNTLITITENGVQYQATAALTGGQYVTTWGTSISSPLEAGIVATIDYVLEGQANPALGFLNPGLYPLASEESASLVNSTNSQGYGTGYSCTGPGNPPNCPYASALPTLALRDVEQGANYYYAAARGYDLVTGWGSIDAYNYTMYFLSVASTGVNGRLSGVEDQLALTGLAVTSTSCLGGGSCYYNASIQQNFFLANSLGAPVYWVQNVIYIKFFQGSWYMWFTGWVIYPFYGIYYSLSLYEFNYPTGQTVPIPHTFDVKSVLVVPSGFNQQYIAFSVDSQTLDLPVPGASYIIGSLSYNYSWQGVTYSNGPFPNNPVPGGLAPQFGLVGGPSGGIGDFTSPTSGTLTATVEPYGANSFVPASTESYGTNIDQTGETASNLAWAQQSGDQWSLGLQSGSATQGVLAYESAAPSAFAVTFDESGLASGTPWSVTLNGTTQTSTTGSIAFQESDGTYSYTVGSVSGYMASPSSGTLMVNDAPVTESIVFTSSGPTLYAVTFTESGLPSGTTWSVTLNGAASTSSTSSIVFNEADGTYSFTVGGVSGYAASPPSGSVTVNGGAVTQPITFTATAPSAYPVTFTESGLPSGTSWSVTLDGVSVSSTTNTISYTAPNGTYAYSVGGVSGYTASPPSGSITVNGAAVTQPITFTAAGPSAYTVTFRETGLPSGTSWSVTLNGGTESSTTTSITFSEANGVYDFTVGTVNGYTASPSSGSITVSGAAVTEAVTFTATSPSSATSYTQAAGLAQTAASGYQGGGWQVLTGAALALVTSVSVTSSSFYNQTDPACQVIWIGTARTTFTFPATSTNASVGTANAWVFEMGQISGGSVLVVTVENGTAVLEYTVSPGNCVSTGSSEAVPSGIIDSPAAVSAANSAGGGSFLGSYPSSTRIWEVLSNASFEGSHTFWVVIYTTCPLSGGSGTGHEFAADIDAVSGAVDYSGTSVVACGPTAAQYTVTFTETGLPSGTTWSVTLNGTTVLSTTSTVTFSESNGTYAYTVASVAGYEVSPSGGTVTVAGMGVTEDVTFTARPPPTYAVIFAEGGLTLGSSWSIALNGVTDTSTGSSITFSEANGSYSFTVETVPGYTATPASGTVTVAGANVAQTITFAAMAPTTYAVTFTETGLPSGTSWSMTLHGATETSTGSSITFSEPNGTYSFSVGSVSGYTVSPASGSITVSGGSVTDGITFSAAGGGGGGSGGSGLLGLPGSTGYILLGAIAVVVVAVSGVALAARARRRRSSPSRPSWPPEARFPTGPGPASPVQSTSAVLPVPPTPPPAAAPPPSPPPLRPPPSAARFCGTCGRPFAAESERFCPACGSPR